MINEFRLWQKAKLTFDLPVFIYSKLPCVELQLGQLVPQLLLGHAIDVSVSHCDLLVHRVTEVAVGLRWGNLRFWLLSRTGPVGQVLRQSKRCCVVDMVQESVFGYWKNIFNQYVFFIFMIKNQ